MMSGIETGRINVGARGLGVALRAYELAIRYAQERSAFGKPIAQHQLIQAKLAGMAKLFATEIAQRCVEESMRIHGGYGYSKEFEIERLYRDNPLLLIGEGTNEIQRLIIARGLLRRHAL